MDRAKLSEHRIDFALAALGFADAHVTLREDRIDETGERRWQALGLAGGLEPFLLVVPVYREASDGEEIVRILTARKARKGERRACLQ